jgi:hypothetical protein
MAKPNDETPPIAIDAEPRNADWLKRTWDLDIHDADALRAFLDDIGEAIEDFKKLPIYLWNVEQPGMEWLKDL